MKTRTNDTCPGCDHDGMEFTHYETQGTPGFVHGVLTCPACGWFDECAIAQDDEIGEEIV